jgi:hypothetical protein
MSVPGSTYPINIGALSVDINRPGSESDYLAPSSAEVCYHIPPPLNADLYGAMFNKAEGRFFVRCLCA